MGDDFLDLASVLHFVEADWIGLGRQYLPEATSLLQTSQFAMFSSHSFLCLLSFPPKTSASGIELGQEDAEHFKSLFAHEDKFNEAMRLFRKCGQSGVQEDEEET